MIVLIAGTTHTGKTLCAQRLMERYAMPYFSIDHLKMGLIRSGQTTIGVEDDAGLAPYLWPIVKEMVKTAIENKQNLIVEGCYIPFDWQKDFDDEYLNEIKYYCLIMTEEYINNHFDTIVQHENVIEKRLYASDVTKAYLIRDNKRNWDGCQAFGLPYVLIDNEYDVQIDL